MDRDGAAPRNPLAGLAERDLTRSLVHLVARDANVDLRSITGAPDQRRLPALAPSQQVGVRRIERALRSFGGAVLADDVGLGKSRTALWVGARQEGPVVVVAPASLRAAWRERAAAAGLAWTVVSHAAFSLRNASYPSELTRGLLIVDEAHRFRNGATKRARALGELAPRNELLLLTATPIVNSRRDLLNLLSFFCRDATFLRWTGRSLHALCAASGPVEPVLLPLVEQVVVRRDARVAEALDMLRPGHSVTWRPRSIRDEAVEVEDTVTDRDAVRVIEAAAHAAMLDDEPAQLLEMTMLRRYASSPEAATSTLRRARNYLQRLREAAQTGGWIGRREFRACFGDDADAQRLQLVMPFWFRDGRGRIAEDLPQRIEVVEEACLRLSGVQLAASDRFVALVDALAAEPVCPSLVFATYRETVTAIFEGLAAHEQFERRPLLAVHGDRAWARPGGRIERHLAFRWFAEDWPEPMRAGGERASPVFVMTDVGAEGLDLQRAGRVIHVDLPSSPAALRQRNGRVLRPEGRESVELVTVLPAPVVEKRLGLLERLRRKEGLAATTVGTSDRGGRFLGDEPRAGCGTAVCPGGWPTSWIWWVALLDRRLRGDGCKAPSIGQRGQGEPEVWALRGVGGRGWIVGDGQRVARYSLLDDGELERRSAAALLAVMARRIDRIDAERLEGVQRCNALRAWHEAWGRRQRCRVVDGSRRSIDRPLGSDIGVLREALRDAVVVDDAGGVERRAELLRLLVDADRSPRGRRHAAALVAAWRARTLDDVALAAALRSLTERVVAPFEPPATPSLILVLEGSHETPPEPNGGACFALRFPLPTRDRRKESSRPGEAEPPSTVDNPKTGPASGEARERREDGTADS